MNAILGFLELVKASDINETKRQEYFNIIQSSASQLIDIIDDIIIASQIKTGEISFIKEHIDVNALLKELFRHYKSLTMSKGLHLILKKAPDNLIISSDRHKLKRVLSHLLDNAVKFSKEGAILFGYSHNVSNSSGINFFVKDSGIGICESGKEIIFGYFNQVEIAHSKRPDGTGLGLYIAKSFVEALGGKIWFESKEGQGSEFMVSFP
jgi:signal transduction histidine kinase